MSIAIKVENLSKAYQLGEIGTGTISRDIERWIAKVRGKEDPFLKIGEINERSRKGTSDVVWSLKDINFEIQQGDAVGIIGRNGAGKSTLLKILSRVTSTTTGTVKARGRIASLLEVGTGFHPELTGRENIYLNGAILGMRKREIVRKFDEIVDFAGVERYIDTPVKRYSSGMYVRLAFAVAAYLESEILIVDEVLAVGDAEFQKKCLGKMGEISTGQGRTVLFVSHNITAIKSLCNAGILLKDGQLECKGLTNEVVDKYLQHTEFNFQRKWNWEEAPGTALARLLEVEIITKEHALYIDNPLSIRFKVQLQKTSKEKRVINFSLVFSNQEEVTVFNVSSKAKIISDDILEAVCHIPAHLLNDEVYHLRLLLVEDSSIPLFDLHNIMAFQMEEKERESNWYGKWIGTIRPQNLVEWTY